MVNLADEIISSNAGKHLHGRLLIKINEKENL